MPRSEAAKRTLDIAVFTVAVGTAVGLAAFASVSGVEPGQPLTTAQVTAALVFGLSAVILLLGSIPYYEDLKRLGLPASERRLWVLGWALLGPVAIAAYWFRYVREAEAPF